MSALPFSPSLDLLTRAVLDREQFIAVIGDRAGDLAAVLDAADVAMAGQAVRLVRVRGDPSAPLAVGDVIRALGGDERTDDGQDAAERVLEALTRRVGGEDQVVLAIEHAEMLQPQVLSFLQLLPAIRRNGSPLLQVLFAGRPDFWTLLDQDAFRPLRDQLATCVTIARTEQRAMVPMSEARSGDRAIRRRRIAAGLLACAAAVVGLGFIVYGFFYRGIPYEFAAISHPAEQAAPPPIPPAPPAPAAQLPEASPPAVATPAGPPPDHLPPVAVPPTQAAAAPVAVPAPSEPAPAQAVATVSAGEDRERLRREFDEFLDQSDAARLTEAQRGLLFEQYVARRGDAGPPVADPSAAPRSPPVMIRRVVIRYPARSGSGEAEAARLRSVLRPNAERAELRAVSDAAREPVIRYFFVEDEAAAKEVAADLHGTGADWRVEDFTAHRPRPSRGTVEVWLPEPE